MSFAVAAACGLAAVPTATGHPPGAGHPFIDLRITITDEQVRYAMEVELEVVDRLVRVERKDRYSFDLEERTRLHEAVDQYFKNSNPVTIDGLWVKPILPDVQLTWFPSVARVAPHVNITLEYPIKGRPKQVSMVWEVFPKDSQARLMGTQPYPDIAVELKAYGQRHVVVFKKNDPEVIWHAPWERPSYTAVPPPRPSDPATFSLPLVSVILIGAGLITVGLLRHSAWSAARRLTLFAFLLLVGVAVCLRGVGAVQMEAPWDRSPRPPSEQEARDIFESLHRNIYRAFDYESESDIYDALAQSVDGNLLDQIYNEVYQSLILRDEGGAVCGIQSVDVLDSRVEHRGVMPDSGQFGFQVEARWRVHGAVSHWGHSHFRTNEYKALHTVAQRDAKWKITGVEVLRHGRVEPDDDNRDKTASKAFLKDKE